MSDVKLLFSIMGVGLVVFFSTILFAYAAPTAVSVDNGGTGTTTAPVSWLIYGGRSGHYQATATSSFALGTAFSYTGTIGSLVGGLAGTLNLATNGVTLSNLATQNANTVLVNQTSGSAAPTALATSTFAAHLHGDGTAGQVLYWPTSGIPTWVATTTLTNGAGITTTLNGNQWTITNTGVLTTRNINTTYPLQGGGDLSADRTLSTAFGTTSTWGIGNDQFIYTSHAGIPLGVASSSLSLPNTALQNSSLTVTAGGNLTGGGSVALGSAVTLTGLFDPFSTHTAFYGASTPSATSTLVHLTGAPFSFAASSTSAFDNASTTELSAGTTWFTGITGTAGNCLHVDTNGKLSGMGADCGSSAGLTSYDAWTHAQLGVSATTSAIGVGTTTPWGQFSISSTTAGNANTALFAIASNTNATLFDVMGSGSVGIASTSPSSQFLLDVNGRSLLQFATTSFQTIPGALWLTGLTGPNGLALDGNGKVYAAATSTLSTISGTLALTQLANQNANTVLVNQTSASAAPTALATSTFGNGLFGFGTGGQVLMEQSSGIPAWVGTTTAGTGLTYNVGAPGNFSVNSSQSIATLSNLSTNGFVRTSGSNGTLGVQTDPCTYAEGCTGSTTAPVSQLLYGGASAYQSVATSSLAVGTGLTNSGTLGAQVGGTAASISFAAINANTIWANNTGASAVPTAIATSSLFAGTAGQVLARTSAGTWTGVATTTFSGGLSYLSGNVTIDQTGNYTWTGTHDFSTGTLVIPNGSAPAVSAIGSIALDTTDNQLILATSTNASFPAVFRSIQPLFRARVGSTSAPFFSGGFVTGKTIGLPTDVDGWRAISVTCSVWGGTSIVVNLIGSTAGSSNTATCSTATSTTSITSNNSYAASEGVSLQTGTVTGTPDFLYFTINGSITRE